MKLKDFLIEQDSSSIFQPFDLEQPIKVLKKRMRSKSFAYLLLICYKNKLMDKVKEIIDSNLIKNFKNTYFKKFCDEVFKNRNNEKDLIEYILTHVSSEHIKDVAGYFLYLALKRGDSKWTLYFLNFDIDPNSFPFLIMALDLMPSDQDNQEIIKKIIKKGADINQKNEEGQSAFHIAVYKHSLEIVKIFLSNSRLELNEKDKEKALRLAVIRNYFQMVKYLLGQGFEVSQDIFNASCKENCPIEIMNIILKYDKDKKIDGNASNNSYINSINPLIKICAKYAQYNNTDVETIKLLIERGADVNTSNHFYTPLSYACKNKYNNNEKLEIIKILLKNGADPDFQTSFKEQPALISACANESTTIEIVQLLLNAGADINKKDIENKTPLFYALVHNEKLIPFLLKNGAKIENLPPNAQKDLLKNYSIK